MVAVAVEAVEEVVEATAVVTEELDDAVVELLFASVTGIRSGHATSI